MKSTHFCRISMLLLGLNLAATPVLAKSKANSKQRNPATATAAVTAPNRLTAIKRSYRLGEINRAVAWSQLADLAEASGKLPINDRVALLQTQSIFLAEAGFPILSAIYSAQAIKLSPTPLDATLNSSWQILRKVSQLRPIQNVIELTADQLEAKGRGAPIFANDWNYYEGNAAARHGEFGKALNFYSALRINDRHYLPGKYQQAMILIDGDKLDEAEAALRAILQAEPEGFTEINEITRKRMIDYAHLALGRLYYEQQKFGDSIKMYRAVSRDGLSFYDALFEQSWALFMAGYPAHALGALHGVESPFFKDVFNPEAPLLRAMINYWLCRYEPSRNALSDFMGVYEPQVEKLNDFLSRKRLDADTAYTLFENLITGVSEESLGLPKSVLKTAAEKDSMLLVRDQFAAIIEEKQRLETKGIFGSKARIERPLDYLQRWSGILRQDIGRHYLAELQDLKKDFERLHSQAEFLYVELLMSEKDQILGKELHASTKITHVSNRQQIGGWGSKTQSWKDDRNGEFWWDEVGFYIQPVTSMCSIRAKSE